MFSPRGTSPHLGPSYAAWSSLILDDHRVNQHDSGRRTRLSTTLTPLLLKGSANKLLSPR